MINYTTDSPNLLCARYARFTIPLLLWGIGGVLGCSSSDGPYLSDYLEELEINTQLEALKEVPVGNFKVSAATLAQEDEKGSDSRTWVNAKCKIYVVVDPGDEKGLLGAYERHRGMFDDLVVQILRSASMDELTDPRWATIKSRISDAARSVLGGERVRDVVLDHDWEPI